MRLEKTHFADSHVDSVDNCLREDTDRRTVSFAITTLSDLGHAVITIVVKKRKRKRRKENYQSKNKVLRCRLLAFQKKRAWKKRKRSLRVNPRARMLLELRSSIENVRISQSADCGATPKQGESPVLLEYDVRVTVAFSPRRAGRPREQFGDNQHRGSHSVIRSGYRRRYMHSA